MQSKAWLDQPFQEGLLSIAPAISFPKNKKEGEEKGKKKGGHLSFFPSSDKAFCIPMVQKISFSY